MLSISPRTPSAPSTVPATNQENPKPTIPLFERNCFKRASPAEQQHILRLLTGVQLTESDIQSLQTSDFSAPFFQGHDWPLRAIKAYEENHLKDDEICQLLLYDTCSKVAGFRLYSTKSEMKWNEILQQGFARWPEMQESIQNLKTQLLPNELQVFSYRYPCEIKLHEETWLYAMLHYQSKFMPIIRHEASKELEILIIPPPLFLAILKQKYGPQTMLPIPVLGYREKEILSDPTKRVMSIHHPLIPATSVHGETYTRGCPLIYFHDMYHLFVESANPYRKELINLAKLAQNVDTLVQASSIKDSSALSEEAVSLFRLACLDRDLPQVLTRPEMPKLSHLIFMNIVPKLYFTDERPSQEIEALERVLKGIPGLMETAIENGDRSR